MTAKELRWPFIGALTVLIILGIVSGIPTTGASEETVNGRYRFAGGTTPLALGYALLVIGLYTWLMYASPAAPGKSVTGVFRRFVAFWLDFTLAMFVVTPIVGILPTVTEWRRTGVFAWNFQRTAKAPGDTLLAMTAVLFCGVVLVFYFALPLIRGKPSPGSCIVGYQIVPDEGTHLSFRTSLLRTLLGFIAVCGAYFAPFVARDRQKGKFWLDKVFGTRAVTLN